MFKLNPWKWMKAEDPPKAPPPEYHPRLPQDPEEAARILEELGRAIPYPATVGEFLTAVLHQRPDIRMTVAGLRDGETLTVSREPMKPVTITAKAARTVLAAALLEDHPE